MPVEVAGSRSERRTIPGQRRPSGFDLRYRCMDEAKIRIPIKFEQQLQTLFNIIILSENQTNHF